MLLNWEAREVLFTVFSKGRTHDFKLFRQSCTRIPTDTVVLADLGYLGLEKLHAHTCLPLKATKHPPLTYEQKQAIRTLARLRLCIEQVIGRLKVFRILAERYRSRGKRFSLRFHLIAAIHNLELSFSLCASHEVH